MMSRSVSASHRTWFTRLASFSTDRSTIASQEELLFPRTVQTMKEKVPESDAVVTDPEVNLASPDQVIDDWDDNESRGDKWRKEKELPREVGFKYKGPEPTMFGDWQHKGRATDF